MHVTRWQKPIEKATHLRFQRRGVLDKEDRSMLQGGGGMKAEPRGFHSLTRNVETRLSKPTERATWRRAQRRGLSDNQNESGAHAKAEGVTAPRHPVPKAGGLAVPHGQSPGPELPVQHPSMRLGLALRAMPSP